MENFLKPGIKGSERYTISHNDLASTLKTGEIAYAATPALIILMEKTICNVIQERIPTQYTSVSAEINIKHLIPLAEGDEVNCSVHLKFVEENKLFFDFAIFNDQKDIAAIGAHERFLVNKEEFSK